MLGDLAFLDADMTLTFMRSGTVIIDVCVFTSIRFQLPGGQGLFYNLNLP